MAEKYREFDMETSPSISSGFKGFSFTKREVIMGILLIIFLLVIIILAALLATSSNGGNSSEHEAQKGKDWTTTASPTLNSTATSTAAPTSASCPACPVDTSCDTVDCFRVATHAFELLNKSASEPCDDFYKFACSNFPALNPLNPDKYEVTTSSLIYDKNMEKIRRVVEAVPSTEDPQHYEYKIKTFYKSCLDHTQRTGLKGGPFLQKVVAPSGGWWVLEGDGNWPPSGYSFQNQMEKVHVDFWTDAFFTFWVAHDWLDWNKGTIEIDLGGLGLHYTAYEIPEEIEAYRAYIYPVAELLFRDAKVQVSEDEKTKRLTTFVNDVLLVEKELSSILNRSAIVTDPHSLDKRLKLSELNANSTGVLDWVNLFTHMFNTDSTLVTADTYVIVYEQEYVQNFIDWIRNLDSSNKTRILNNYLVWRLADTYSRYLSWEYLRPYFQFRMNQTGVKEVPDTWLFCLDQLTGSMKEALGALFVRDHFSDVNRKASHQITDYVRQAMKDSLNNDNHWMSSASRQIARKKITDSLMKLGYPDYMMNENTLNTMYASLNVRPDDYFGSILSIHALTRQVWIRFFKHPNDRDVWWYGVYTTVPEYYNPWKELFVPAGALQFPIFDHRSPGFMNFGSMGSLVGRELTYAVDEIGSQYLLNGSHFGEWWSANTKASYETVRQCVTRAYSSYRMGPFPLFGKMTVSDHYIPSALRESSGVKLAYQGYKKWIAEKGSEASIPGGKYTNDQMFFISYAQSFCANRDALIQALQIWFFDTVTERIRVNGALGQLQEFQDAFQCQAQSNMVAQKRCNLY